MAEEAAPAKRARVADEPQPLEAALRACSAAGQGVLLVDGGLATHLEALGQDIDHSLWSAKLLQDGPEKIQQAHGDFFAAGANVAITASYQAHFDGFRELGVDEAGAVALMQRSVALAQRAREAAVPGPALVAGSVGSYGASLHNGAEYTGDYPGMDEEKLLAWHRPRATALVEAGADLLACETIPCLMEAKALARLLAELKHPAWVTFSCKSGTQVCSGEPLEACVRAVAASPVVAVGVNCTSPQHVAELVRVCAAAKASSQRIVVYPNSGEEWDGEKHEWRHGDGSASDRDFVAMAKVWNEAGADCIGGCCRTTPKTIAALREAFTQKPAP